MSAQKRSVLEREILLPAIGATFAKLNPRHMLKNPVMFVTEVGAAVTTVEVFRASAHGQSIAFVGQVALWLWFTVLFANFAEALAEGRGKAQADALRKTRTKTFANREAKGALEKVSSDALRKGDVVVVVAGELIPGDGEIIEGVASVDESVMTGESAPVIRESGGDRSAVTGGTTVLSDRIRIRISADPGESFLDRMIALIEGAKRKKTPNEIALNILLSALTIIFLLVCVGLRPFGAYIQSYTPGLSASAFSTTVLIALLVCLIPTTIGGLLSAIGIAGIDRMVQKNVLAMSGKAVEAAGDVHVLLLDKTGTITIGNRQAAAFYPAPGVEPKRLAEAAHLASLADETPEGKSIVALAAKDGRNLPTTSELKFAEFVEFTAQTRMSGVDVDGRAIRKGASDAIRDWVGKNFPIEVDRKVEEISKNGGTPLVVADGGEVLGTVYLKDIVKPGYPSASKSSARWAFER
jgi:potassium-transporting ATPase ATP-binding subunit